MATKAKIKSKEMKKERKLRMPHVFTILFGIVIITMIITWSAPSGYYVSDSFFSAGIKPVGIVDSFMAFGYGFLDAGSLVFFLFGIGAFINMVMKSQAMEATIGSGLKKLKGKEIWMIPTFMLFFAFGGTTYGMAEETLGFYLILVPIFVLAGFDAITGVFVILLGAGVGVLASTVNPFAIGAAVDAVGGDISIGDGMGFRWMAFVVFYIAAVSFVMYYAKKVSENKDHSALSAAEQKEHVAWAKKNYDLDKLPKMDTSKRVTLGLFFFSLIWMVFTLIPWDEFGIEVFVSFAELISDKAPWIDSSEAWTIGWWYFLELGIFFTIMSIIIGFVNKNKEAQVYEYAVEGAKDMMGVALVISLARAVTIVLGGSSGELSIVETETAGTFHLIGVGGEVLAEGVQGTENPVDWTAISKGMSDGSIKWLEDNTVWKGGEIIFGFFNDDGEAIAWASTYAVDVNLTNSLLNTMQPIGGLDPWLYNPVAYIIYLPLSFLVPSTSGLAGATMGIMGPMGEIVMGDSGGAATTITAFSFASGTLNLFTPTSGVVMGGLAICKVEYGTYIKSVSKFLAIVVVLSILLMIAHTWMVF